MNILIYAPFDTQKSSVSKRLTGNTEAKTKRKLQNQI